MFVETHFQAFKSSIDEFSTKRGNWAGFSAHSLVSYIAKLDKTLDIDPLLKSNQILSREDIYSKTLDKTQSNLDFIIDVLSWGGVNRRHAAKALSPEYREAIVDIVGSLRAGDINSQLAYNRFYHLREQKKLPGIGPAYYTKLIFFAHPDHDGFIMDQWTARSINLLLGKPLVGTIKHEYSERVSDKNNAKVYTTFCDAIRKLTLAIDKLADPRLTEEALFSGGGRLPLKWRRYVKKYG
ncbi:hypothetical protein N9X46_02400 [Paracoccaceae bacterium]|nr:hypothetical protein [Paracoccaceae bacterium]